MKIKVHGRWFMMKDLKLYWEILGCFSSIYIIKKVLKFIQIVLKPLLDGFSTKKQKRKVALLVKKNQVKYR